MLPSVSLVRFVFYGVDRKWTFGKWTSRQLEFVSTGTNGPLDFRAIARNFANFKFHLATRRLCVRGG